MWALAAGIRSGTEVTARNGAGWRCPLRCSDREKVIGDTQRTSDLLRLQLCGELASA